MTEGAFSLFLFFSFLFRNCSLRLDFEVAHQVNIQRGGHVLLITKVFLSRGRSQATCS